MVAVTTVPWVVSTLLSMASLFMPSVPVPTTLLTDTGRAKTFWLLLVVVIILPNKVDFRPLLGRPAVQRPLVFNTIPSPAKVPDIRPT